MDVAHRELPDLAIETAYRMQMAGEDAHDVRRQTRQAKIREVEVTANGGLLEVE